MLGSGEVVHEVGQPVETMVFPIDCLVSVVSELDGGDAVDVATVGREGFVDLPGLLGGAVHQSRAVCRVPGAAVELSAAAARRLLAPDDKLVPALEGYLRATLTVLMQRVGCNRSHTAGQRCAAWLLQTQDRVGSDAFELTHETLAQMLGLRRATVSDNLAGLQRRGVLRSWRGTLTVVDRPGLRAASCGCYQAFRDAHRDTFG